MTEYKTTTNNRVFNILHKQQHASCSWCSWHTRNFKGHCENDAWDRYYLDKDPGKYNITKFPSWKLASSKPKQYMGKPLKFKKALYRHRCEYDLYFIEW